jgi:hypothetical protein
MHEKGENGMKDVGDHEKDAPRFENKNARVGRERRAGQQTLTAIVPERGPDRCGWMEPERNAGQTQKGRVAALWLQCGMEENRAARGNKKRSRRPRTPSRGEADINQLDIQGSAADWAVIIRTPLE